MVNSVFRMTLRISWKLMTCIYETYLWRNISFGHFFFCRWNCILYAIWRRKRTRYL